MAIKYYPKTGEILECDFGPDYPRTATGEVDRTAALTSSGNLPPEMVKNRLVVVLNGKLSEGCMVVPLSKTAAQGKVDDGLHVLVDSTLIPGHSYFTVCNRWACGEQVQQVSKLRLNTFHPDRAQRPVLPLEVMNAIKRAVIKAIRAGDLLAPKADLIVPPAPMPTAQPERAAAPSNSMLAAFEAAQVKKATMAPTAVEAATAQGQASATEGSIDDAAKAA
jgi:uncharacterized protein YifN (PemK superfamily)